MKGYSQDLYILAFDHRGTITKGLLGVEGREPTQDEANKVKIEAKNGLENYCFNLRNSMDDPNLKDKFEVDDKQKIEDAVKDALDWLDKNQLAEKEEFEKSRIWPVSICLVLLPTNCRLRGNEKKLCLQPNLIKVT